ncbi:urea carboxylase-associated family protein [uncultured Algimonas sp.]|uniref:urea carboxylase-associated family protein n=1 Tax=uncultured Algimonas sp. TaxID=1547920 RepID=UPI00260A1C41|nr:urea carboxylase-associated family protein [uncultured Algimonas sp.]
MSVQRIPPKSGTAFEMKAGQTLRVIDPDGQQVSDLVAYNAHDREEFISSGRSIDYASKMFLSTGDLLYSNRSNPMFRIGRDDVGRHDFTLTPCSRDTFRLLYDDHPILPGCQGNLETALAPYGISPDRVPIAFNVFMHVDVNGQTGEIKVLPPKSGPGDAVEFEALMDLVVAMTACSAGQSNNFTYKPIDYEILD